MATFSEKVLGSDGTVGAPEFSFTSDTDTGLYRIGANALGITTGGTTAGNVTSGVWTLGAASANVTHISNGNFFVLGQASETLTIAKGTGAPSVLLSSSATGTGGTADIGLGLDGSGNLVFRAANNATQTGSMAQLLGGAWTLGTTSRTNDVFPGNTIYGTTKANAAATGAVGEEIIATVVTGSAVSLSNGTAADVTSITLTAGDWDICGNGNFNFGSATTTGQVVSINTTSATLSANSGAPSSGTIRLDQTVIFTTTSATVSMPVPPIRATLAASQTFYLVVRCGFSAGTVTSNGFIRARRVR